MSAPTTQDVDFELRQVVQHLKTAKDVFGWLRELSAVTKDTLGGVALPAGALREMRAETLSEICEYLATVYANEMDCAREDVERGILPALSEGATRAARRAPGNIPQAAMPATRGGAK